MLPSAFKKTRRSLEVINIGSVGFSLASATAAILGAMFAITGEANHEMAIATGVPTLFVGAFWAWLLRQRKIVTMGQLKVRLGWVLAIPLAALNAGVALAGAIAVDEGLKLGNIGLGMILGATFGAIVWIPALLLTILCFGAPIAWAERQAEKGLSGRERGELIVGVASGVIAALALLVARFENPFASALGVVALMGATLAVLESASRGRARKRFLAEVEAGRVEHFRIDTVEEGRALVRVVPQGEAYRVADYEEEVAALDDFGDVTETHVESERAVGRRR